MERNSSIFTSAHSLIRKFVFAMMLSTATLLSVQAGSIPPVDKSNLVSITSLGVTDGEMAFNLKFNNAGEDRLLIILTDSENFVLYKEIIATKTLDKNFRTTSDLGTVILTITNLKDKSVHKYSISNEKRVVEELAITSLK